MKIFLSFYKEDDKVICILGVIVVPLRLEGAPTKTVEWSVCVNIALRVSTAKPKISGERGSPLRMPCLHQMYPHNALLINT